MIPTVTSTLKLVIRDFLNTKNLGLKLNPWEILTNPGRSFASEVVIMWETS